MPLSVIVPPTHTVDAAVAEMPVGAVPIVIAEVVAIVLPQLLDAVSVYIPAEAVFTVNAAGLRSVAV